MRKFVLVMLALIGAPAASAVAQSLPGDQLIVPGVRIGAAELAPADQGALLRDLGEPNETEQKGDHAYYRYGASPGELTVDFDMADDAPFEISTTSPGYRTREGLGVGSKAADLTARLGSPICQGGSGAGDALMAYDAIWFLLSRGTVTKVSIRTHLDARDVQESGIFCR